MASIPETVGHLPKYFLSHRGHLGNRSQMQRGWAGSIQWVVWWWPEGRRCLQISFRCRGSAIGTIEQRRTVTQRLLHKGLHLYRWLRNFDSAESIVERGASCRSAEGRILRWQLDRENLSLLLVHRVVSSRICDLFAGLDRSIFWDVKVPTFLLFYG